MEESESACVVRCAFGLVEESMRIPWCAASMWQFAAGP
jgi:hypothetical protein